MIVQLLGQPTLAFTWFVLLVCGIGFCMAALALAKRMLLPDSWNSLATAMISTFAVFLAVEGILRLTGYTENYSEARLGYYDFIRHGSYKDTLHVWPTNDTHEIGDGVQFLYPRETNSLGLSDKEWQKEKPDSVFRIIAYGDSFTEGDGAPADSSWPKLLEQQMLTKGKRVEVLNAGVCGSDPFFSLMLHKLHLSNYEPDMVIFTISFQDIYEDIATRGGMERFDPESGRYPKLFELIYAVSHLARLVYHRFLGYSWVLTKENDPEFVAKIVDHYIPELFTELKGLQTQTGTDIMVILYPHFHNLEEGYPDVVLEGLKYSSEENNIVLRDIQNCYANHIDSSGQTAEAFWWQSDWHHNSKGYLMMANCIGQEIGL